MNDLVINIEHRHLKQFSLNKHFWERLYLTLDINASPLVFEGFTLDGSYDLKEDGSSLVS